MSNGDGGSFRLGGHSFRYVAVPASLDVPESLTASEREIATLVCQGHSNSELAAARDASINTVKNQLASIYRKLDVASRMELIERLTSD